ncbi:MAG: hypothetical protein JO110_04035 [Acetobacteraceae bacterium]|nr:hypothetical protein [Acetobacteraceae bacterium]
MGSAGCIALGLRRGRKRHGAVGYIGRDEVILNAAGKVPGSLENHRPDASFTPEALTASACHPGFILAQLAWASDRSSTAFP